MRADQWLIYDRTQSHIETALEAMNAARQHYNGDVPHAHDMVHSELVHALQTVKKLRMK